MIAGRRETLAFEARALAGGPKDGDAAAQATWTALRIYVQNRNLFRNGSRDTHELSDDVKWPAVHLARWLVRSWDDVFHTGAWPWPATMRNARDIAVMLDEELLENFDAPDDVIDRRDRFVASHSLRSAAAGGAFPDVWLSRDGGVASIAWHDSMDGEIYFTLSHGEADVPAPEFAYAVRDFVAWVHELLTERCPEQARDDIDLFATWLDRFTGPEGARAALLAETGLGDGRWERVARLAGMEEPALAEFFDLGESWFAKGTLADVRESPIAVAFRCASPTVTDQELVSIRSAIRLAARNTAGFEALEHLSRRVQQPMTERYDFVRGYKLAREVRRVLGNTADPLDIDALLKDLKVDILNLPLSDPDIDGGCVCDQQHGPLVFLNPHSTRAATEWGRRVVLAHELCHLLFDRDDAVGLGVLSGPWAPPRIERVANAFAIELLLPLAGVIKTVGKAWESTRDSDIQALMDKYGLGIIAVTEHVRNLGDWRNRSLP